MSDEKSVMPDASPTPEQTETIEQLTPKPVELPDEPVNEVEKLKAERDDLAKQAEAIKAEKTALEQRLKDNQAYISRTRNVEKPVEVVRPQKTLEDYIGEVKTKFQDDPAAGLEKVIRDLAYDRDLGERKHAEELVQTEERAFKKALALNPEASKTMKEIEKLDEECPDLQGLSYERKIEFINLRNAGTAKHDNDVRGRITRETDLAGGVGGGGRRGGERISSWVNDPEVAKGALEAGFKTKQELQNWANPAKAKEMYERSKNK